MSSEDGEVYIMRPGDDEGDWVSPVPASEAIRQAVLEASDLDEDDLDDLAAYVDRDDLRAVLNETGDGDLAFDVEDVTVTVAASGEIAVE